MPDENRPPEPRGPVRYAWFAGILEGRPGDIAAMRRTVAAINALRVVHLDLALDGGRFSALFDERTIAGDSLTPAIQDELIRLLRELTNTAAEPTTVESTLRCTAIHDDTAVETLFAPLRGEIQCVSRSRALEPADRERAPGVRPRGVIAEFGHRRALSIGLLMLVAAGLLIWQSGAFERFVSASTDNIEVRTGPFGDLLTVEIEPNWGNYRVLVRRGAGYPDTADDIRGLEAAAQTPAARAAVHAVCDGDLIYVRLHAEDGEVLVFASIQLRPLLSRGDAEVPVNLPGQSAARTVQLALDPGPPK